MIVFCMADIVNSNDILYFPAPLDQSVEYFLMKGVLNYIGSVDVRYLDGWCMPIWFFLLKCLFAI